MRILIVGAGIAGPTLAYWLLHFGYRPTLVERAPALRTGGYIIDFWGAAFDVAERMGLIPRLHEVGYHVEELRLVGARGQRVGGIDASVFERITKGRYVSLPRSALAAEIYAKLDERVETLFDDTVEAIEEGPSDVTVTLARAGERRFDLVIGADGQHSRVRELVFGRETNFEKYLGYGVAAFSIEGYRPRDENVYVMFTERGQQVARFTMREDHTMFLFVWCDDSLRAAPLLPEDQRALVRERFANSGWECPAILDAMGHANDIYMDRVSQIRMDRWSQGRVALVGDAAYCVSLLAGQGSALAMVGALVLAGELHAAQGDYREAFSRYESRLRSFLDGKQRAAEGFASSFAPRTHLGLFLRFQFSKALAIPYVAELAFRRGLRDAIELPEYG
jgi:2-polyprenyl-6-methoxyphenol hydroxylase-like FAD-dependent oxidoreductase